DRGSGMGRRRIQSGFAQMSRFIAAGLVLLLAAATADVALMAARERPDNRTELQLLIARSKLLGETDPTQPLSLNFNLKGRDGGGLRQLLKSGKTVTPQEFDNRFGPDPALVAAARRTLADTGLEAAWQPGSSLLTVDGPVAAIER